MDNIPSNFTFEEVVRYTKLPEPLRQKLEDILNQVVDLENENARLLKREEKLEEEVYFRNEFITSVVAQCAATTRHKDLVAGITTELENSYIEL